MAEKIATSFSHSKNFKYQPYNVLVPKGWTVTEQQGRAYEYWTWVGLHNSRWEDTRFFTLLSSCRFWILGPILTFSTYVRSFSNLLNTREYLLQVLGIKFLVLIFDLALFSHSDYEPTSRSQTFKFVDLHGLPVLRYFQGA